MKILQTDFANNNAILCLSSALKVLSFFINSLFGKVGYQQGTIRIHIDVRIINRIKIPYLQQIRQLVFYLSDSYTWQFD